MARLRTIGDLPDLPKSAYVLRPSYGTAPCEQVFSGTLEDKAISVLCLLAICSYLRSIRVRLASQTPAAHPQGSCGYRDCCSFRRR